MGQILVNVISNKELLPYNLVDNVRKSLNSSIVD